MSKFDAITNSLFLSIDIGQNNIFIEYDARFLSDSILQILQENEECENSKVYFQHDEIIPTHLGDFILGIEIQGRFDQLECSYFNLYNWENTYSQEININIDKILKG